MTRTYGTTDLEAVRAMVAGSRKTEVIDLRDQDAIVYVNPVDNIAMGFSGKRAKADFHYSYSSREKMLDAVERYRAGLQRAIDYKNERKAEKSKLSQLPNPFKVGDVLHYSWGWEQTQCEFYQVTEVKDKTVTVRAIAAEMTEATSSMACMMTAKPGEFLEGQWAETLTKRVLMQSEGSACLKMDHGYARVWNGKPQYRSWYA